MSETVIYVRNLLAAAAALRLTNGEVAARLGVKLETFDRALAWEKNGGRPSVSSDHPKAFAAAMALLEEAGRAENGEGEVAADGTAPRPERETPERGSKGRHERPKSSSSHPGARGSNGFDASNGSGPDADCDDDEHHVGADSEHVGADDADHLGADAAGPDNADHAGTDHAGANGADQANHAGDEDYFDLSPAELIEKATALAGHPDLEKHARALIAVAAAADMDAAEDDQVVNALSNSWGVGKRAIGKLLKDARNAHLAGQDDFGRKQSAADTLFDLVEQAGWKTWKDTRTDEAAVTITPGQHLLTRGRKVKQALVRLWTDRRPGGRRVCPIEALDAVIGTLAAQVTSLDMIATSVVRYAAAGSDPMAPDGVVVDIGDNSFEALLITAQGVTVITPAVVDAMGIRFVRPSLMTALPRPKHGASPEDALDRLTRLISLDQATDVKLVFGVLVASLLPLPAVLPVIVLAAPQGSGKTTTANGLKSVLDPAAVGASAMPRTRDDLTVRLSKARCVALDNVSALDADTTDLLCVASTGGSSTRRALYTDDDELLLQLHATSILTAIDESIFGRSDLLSRTVILGLRKPPDGQHSERHTRSLWTDAIPVVLGGLYAALSRVLDKIDWSGTSVHGRLAASVQVLEALDAAGVCGGGFVSVYASSQQAAAGDFVLRDEMLRDIIRTVLKQPASPIDGAYSWLGSAAALYAAATTFMPQRTGRVRNPL